MLARLKTFTLLGIEAMPVDVEVDISPAAMPKTILVGLPDTAVKESTHRVERAIVNSGFTRPHDRVVINLAPGDLPKQAASFDLPVALGVLAGSGQLAPDRLEHYAIIGELALEGHTRPVKGGLSIAIEAAKDADLRGIVVPAENAGEAAVVEGLEVIPVESLAQAVAFFAEEIEIPPAPSRLEQLFEEFSVYEVDFGDVRGQESAKRAVTLAAAGRHNLIMIGPPGSGKTMLAKRIPTVLPQLGSGESIETTRIYSALGQLPSGQPLLAKRPFRSPHHTISDAGLVGGGSPPAPGEISKAHHGILFLDELPEFNRKTLEVMRQPLEDGVVTISRAMRSTTFPSEFMLVAAANPCPCGYRSDPRRHCNCTPPQVEKYMSRISGPLMDRIDIHIEVPAVPFEELSSSQEPGTSSAQMRENVVRARAAQEQRFGNASAGVRYNAHLSSRQIREHCPLNPTCRQMLRHSVEEMGLSARAHDKILRVARTIADVAGDEAINEVHLAEAIGYRSLDRDLWT
ncbi:YifB family Mg chelatase-like AAA ATPase [Roseiconus nitratireducens]|uniref:YifB family Mg chelatase-like AAA ATPase n=1 Tax=Roseiconus nitratireducens TaxID=2605748 RepID=A0A5M6DN61_9BACT|nr:YifB family Mg chelatase-like AAA ATPase [Roseiconus nitratireducens]KAA5546855.1 YifB family Mg chelatase-like AAA ATPase [Roseiconus nitratireducens]